MRRDNNVKVFLFGRWFPHLNLRFRYRIGVTHLYKGTNFRSRIYRSPQCLVRQVIFHPWSHKLKFFWLKNWPSRHEQWMRSNHISLWHNHLAYMSSVNSLCCGSQGYHVYLRERRWLYYIWWKDMVRMQCICNWGTHTKFHWRCISPMSVIEDSLEESTCILNALPKEAF